MVLISLVVGAVCRVAYGVPALDDHGLCPFCLLLTRIAHRALPGMSW